MSAAQMVYWVLYFLVMMTICVLNIVFPRKMWGLFKSWRFKNPDQVEPSDLVVWWYRVSGVLGMILFVSLGVFGGMAIYRDARCEAVLPELTELYETDGISAVERRAHDLGLEVEDNRTRGSFSLRGKIVITDDGKPFATIWTSTSDAQCDV